MKIARKERMSAAFKALCLLLLLAVLLACRFSLGDESNNSNNSNNRNRSSSSSSSKSEEGNEANAELCRKYDSCGCESYDNCMRGLANDRNIEKPGVRECMLNSSCQSLCAGKPDGCTAGQSTDAGSGTGQQRSNCAAIPCSNKSDCPTDCYGGCDGVRCYSF